MLQGNGALHVRSSVINVPRHWQEPVVDCSCAGVVVCFASLDHLQQWLRCDVTISNKHTIDVEAGVEQVLVMAGQDSKIRVLSLDDGNLDIPSAHVAYTILHSDDTWLRCNFEKSLQVVGSFGVVGILEQNERESGFLVHHLVPVLRGYSCVSKAFQSFNWGTAYLQVGIRTSASRAKGKGDQLVLQRPSRAELRGQQLQCLQL
jgi:hypothetical protein